MESNQLQTLPKEAAGRRFQASRWQKMELLLAAQQLEELFSFLAELSCYPLGRVIAAEQLDAKPSFLKAYCSYMESLQKGETPPLFSPEFNVALSASADCFYKLEAAEGRFCLQVAQPVIQVKALSLGFSEHDKTLRSDVRSQEAIAWGLSFSYPALYQDPLTQKMSDTKTSVNTPCFKKLQRWLREASRPVCFKHLGKEQRLPIRLGKPCYEWIDKHPQLKAYNLEVCL